jgi:hypothetical protein
MSLFLDIAPLSCGQTDHTLEFLHKSISDGDGDSLFDEHPSPLVRKLIELFSARGLDRLENVRKELTEWAQGTKSTGGEPTPRPPGAMERWTKDELRLARIYLERLPPAKWTYDDHGLMVDYLVQKYLPADELMSEAEWLAARSTLMGRVQTSMTAKDRQADKLAGALPLTVAEAEKRFKLTPAQLETLNYAKAHAGENVRAFKEDARHALRRIVTRRARERATGQEQGSLQTELMDRFAILNRDWRRIAVTEAGEALNQGYISSLEAGSQVKRVEQYRGACPFCRKIDGVIATVVSPDKADKDGDTEIWVGKDNVGRSASPMKRVGDKLVPRSVDELWWLPAGLAHPNCRGRWVATIRPKPGDDPDFHKWMMETLNPKR